LVLGFLGGERVYNWLALLSIGLGLGLGSGLLYRVGFVSLDKKPYSTVSLSTRIAFLESPENFFFVKI